MYSLTVLKVRSLKWVSRAASLLEAGGKNPFPCFSSSQRLSAVLSTWPCPPSLKPAVWFPQITPSLTSDLVVTSPSPTWPPASLLSKFSWWHWTQLDNSGQSSQLNILYLITPARLLLPCKVTSSQVLGIRMETSLRGDHCSVYYNVVKQKFPNFSNRWGSPL